MVKYVDPLPVQVEGNLKLQYLDRLWIGGSYIAKIKFISIETNTIKSDPKTCGQAGTGRKSQVISVSAIKGKITQRPCNIIDHLQSDAVMACRGSIIYPLSLTTNGI